MNPELWQTISAGAIALGVILSGLGGFGQYYFGKLSDEAKEAQRQQLQEQKEAAEKKLAEQLAKERAAAEQTQAEQQRRANILAKLRALYLSSHDNISPEMLSGVAPLPKEWTEQQLHKLGETWRQDSYQ